MVHDASFTEESLQKPKMTWKLGSLHVNIREHKVAVTYLQSPVN